MIATFVANYGYLAVFAGTLLEGETILLAAGFAAHCGLLDWKLVALTAMAGGALGDQISFLLGRWRGDWALARFPRLAALRPRVQDLLARHDVLIIPGIRFVYGLRIAGPLIMGWSRISPLRFGLLNLVGAAFWALVITGAGYAFGTALAAMLDDLKRVEEAVLVLILLLGGGLWLWRRRRAGKP